MTLPISPRELLPVYQDVILPLADVAIPNQFEAELITGTIPVDITTCSAPGQTITNEKEALAVMEMLHKKGVSTVILSRFNKSILRNRQYYH